jgi:hypothetical protein
LTLLSACGKHESALDSAAAKWAAITNAADYRRWWSYPTEIGPDVNASQVFSNVYLGIDDFVARSKQSGRVLGDSFSLASPFNKDRLSHALLATRHFLDAVVAVGPSVGQFEQENILASMGDVYDLAFEYAIKILGSQGDPLGIKAVLEAKVGKSSSTPCVKAAVVYAACLINLIPQSHLTGSSESEVGLVAGLYVSDEAHETSGGVGHLYVEVREKSHQARKEDQLFLDPSPLDGELIRFKGESSSYRGVASAGIRMSAETGKFLGRTQMILLLPPDLKP